MGFTHYINRKESLPKDKFKLFSKDVRLLLSKSEVPFKYYSDTEEHEGFKATDEEINFNGVGEDGHENVYIVPNDPSFSFCKTARKPYDKYVVAVYILGNLHFIDDLQDGLDLVNELFNYNVKIEEGTDNFKITSQTPDVVTEEQFLKDIS